MFLLLTEIFLITDISVKDKMALVISFWDGKMNSELLQLARCKDATAEGLTTALLDILKESNILKTQMVGFPADTCNTMFGENNSVSQRLKQEIPHVCLLPSIIEEFVRGSELFQWLQKEGYLLNFKSFIKWKSILYLNPD